MDHLQKASEILRVDNGVQIFYIADDGSVSTPSYPTTLSIYSFDESSKAKSNDKNVVGFVRVGSWMYPLVPKESPAMKTNFNAYIFPNGEEDVTNSGAKCSFVGITFAAGTSDDSKVFFEDVLRNYDLLIYQNRDEAAVAQSDVKPAPAPRVVAELPAPPASVLVDTNARVKPGEFVYPLEPEKTKPGLLI